MSYVSMTGFGRGTASSSRQVVDVELSSVNRRQLDIHLSLPRGLSAYESRIHKEIKKVISRGRITGTINATLGNPEDMVKPVVDEALAAAYVAELRKVGKRLKLDDNLDVNLLMSLPDVVRTAQQGEGPQYSWTLIRKALGSALAELAAMRLHEGAVLHRDISKRFTRLAKLAEKIKGRAPTAQEQYRKQLVSRLRKAGLPVDLNDERLLKEVAYYAERSDISEELTRIHSHLEQARALEAKPEPVGRRLDFLAQELNREINTAGSKAGDARIAQWVISFKAELEKIREQVQNIE